MRTNIKVIKESGQKEFEEKVNNLAKGGYWLSSSGCGYARGIGDSACDREFFMAIMVKDGGRKVDNA